MSDKEQLVQIFSRLGVAELSRILGREKVERLAKFNISIEVYALAEFLIVEYGLNILKKRDIRKKIIIEQAVSPDRIKEIYPTERNADNIYSFVWGNNQKTKRFLKLLELSNDSLISPSKSVSPIELIEIVSPLYPYQNWIRKKINNFLFDSRKKRTIVHMPTGSGKTRTCMEAICDFMRQQEVTSLTIVWFAHSEELCEQAAGSFIEIWGKIGNEDVDLVRMWGGHNCNDMSFDRPTFVVTSFQTAYKMLHTADDRRFRNFTSIKSRSKLIIVDEAHQSTAPTYSDAINLFSNQNTKILGLTATPGRHHQGQENIESVRLAEFYENNKINIVSNNGESLDNPIQYLTEIGVLAKIKHHKIKSNAEINLTEAEKKAISNLLDIPQTVLKKIGEDTERTLLIVAQVMKLAINRHHPTIVFAPSKENATEIAAILKHNGCDASAITSETEAHSRRDAIDNYKTGNIKVLTNFGVLTTGFDAPNTKAVIVARPTTSVVLYSQMIGRGLRGTLMGGNEECVIVDVIDNIQNMPNIDDAFTYFDNLFGVSND